MKINGINNLTSWYSRVLDREGNGHEDQQGSGRQHSKDQTKDQESQGDETTQFQVTDEQIQHAIELFSKDSQTLENGLSADVIGKGAGLRVVLKDSDGHTLRALKPVEFMTLQRESQVSPKEVLKGVGKILDRKY